MLLYTVVTATANYRYTTEIAPCDPTRCQAMPSTSAWPFCRCAGGWACLNLGFMEVSPEEWLWMETITEKNRLWHSTLQWGCNRCQSRV